MKKLALTRCNWGSLWIAIVLSALCSCSRGGYLKDERIGKGDLTDFIKSRIVIYGGTNIPVNSFPISGITDYFYSEDESGFQVVCESNRVGSLQTIFKPVLGSPALSTTNSDGIRSFVYGAGGVAINCCLEETELNGKRTNVTHLVVVRSEALK